MLAADFLTWSLPVGDVVPIPTLPPLKIVTNLLAPPFQLPGEVLYFISSWEPQKSIQGVPEPTARARPLLLLPAELTIRIALSFAVATSNL